MTGRQEGDVLAGGSKQRRLLFDDVNRRLDQSRNEMRRTAGRIRTDA